ncbi:F-box protein At3g07870-like [Papaver somniferum]|uniref:F-box protein At3g07870-like n=1 Tax=Papaver somniferum TaxID=3469 RepID=UPI000E6F82E7|nr:F-box protein At3g07870-like [Papaver somniferum]
MDYFKFILYEVISEILTPVPAESALDCKLVCTSWRNIVSDPSFNQMHCHHHLNHPSDDSCTLGFLALTENELFYYFEYNQNQELTTSTERIRKIISTSKPEDNFVGSCNGLICIVQEDEPDSPVSICNPFTKQYVLLPQIRKNTDDDLFWSFGFGYVSLTNEYKVVGIYVSLLTKYVEVHIYTLGSGNGWRDLGKFNLEFSPRRDNEYEHGKFSNGAIYWIGREIVTFDLIEEKFCKHLAPPPMPPNTNLQNHTIGVLDVY